MSSKEITEEEPKKTKNGRRKKEETDDPKFKELEMSDTELETEVDTEELEPVIHEQKPVKRKSKHGAKRQLPQIEKKKKSVMELANCPNPVNPKHWKIAQARARRKNEINQN